MNKKLLIPILLLGFWLVASAASEGPNSVGTAANDNSVGTAAWESQFDTGTITSSDNSYWVTTAADVTDPTVITVSLVKDGTVSGDDKATGAALPNTDTYISYGSSSDLWGLVLTPDDINASDFGMVFQTHMSVDDGGGAPHEEFDSHYLKATNFGFDIPAGATIDGVLVEVEAKYASVAGSFTPSVDHIRMTVTYTDAVTSQTEVAVRTGTIKIQSGTLFIK